MADMAHSASGAALHGADAHGHEHPAFLQHHFETPAQQFDASKLGMWLFLATEVLFFAGLFCAYAVYRANHPHIFMAGHKFLDVYWGAVNTVVLILSSFTMALGVWCAQKSYQRGLVICLALTLLGACGFMAIKAVEYTDKLANGKVWGKGFAPVKHDDHGHAGDHGAAASHAADPTHAATDAHAAAPADAHATPAADAAHASPAAPATPAAAAPPVAGLIEESKIKLAAIGPSGVIAPAHDEAGHGHGIDPYEASKNMRDMQIFIAIYFCMTGLHGVHVLAGMGVLTWLLIGAIQGRYNSEYYTPVDLGGLYWHLVDLVWIYLFPMLYLIH